jgi:hypothetical protein
MGRAMVLGNAVALALCASPAAALNVVCQVGTKPCHGTCISKHKSCLRCSDGTWFCNGRCIPKGMDCATPFTR